MMKKMHGFLAALFFMAPVLFLDQSVPGAVNEAVVFKRHFNQMSVKSFLLSDNRQVWSLTYSGDILVWDLAGVREQIPRHVFFRSPVKSLAQDKKSRIFAGCENGDILVGGGVPFSWKPYAHVGLAVDFIHPDAGSQGFAVTPGGIVDLASGRRYFPRSFHSTGFRNFRTEWEASCSLLDPNGNIWVGCNYGEFGGDLFVFDIEKKSFLGCEPPKGEKSFSPIISLFCDSKGLVYATCGLQHLGFSDGFLMSLQNRKSVIIAPAASREKVNVGSDKNEFVGPGQFNPFDRHIYYYSDRGFFTSAGELKAEGAWQWRNILKPQLLWVLPARFAVGAKMNVNEFRFLNKTDFVFASDGNGLGVYRQGEIFFLGLQSLTSDYTQEVIFGDGGFAVKSHAYADQAPAIFQAGQWLRFRMDVSQEEHFYGLTAIIPAKANHLVFLLERKREKPEKEKVVTLNEAVGAFVLADGRLQPFDFPLPKLPIDSDPGSLKIEWAKSDSDRLLLVVEGELVEYDRTSVRAIFPEEESPHFLSGQYLPGNVIAARFSRKGHEFLGLIQEGRLTEIPLPPEPREPKNMTSFTLYEFLQDQDSRTCQFFGYGQHIYMLLANRIYQLENEKWLPKNELARQMASFPISLIKFFPKENLLCFRCGKTAYAWNGKKALNLNRSLGLDFFATNFFCHDGKLYVTTFGRGLIEVEIPSLNAVLSAKR